MSSFTLYPAAAGFYSGWHDLSGAPSAWEACDESPHDGDLSYFRLGALGTLPDQAGRVSCRLVQVGLGRIMPAFVRMTALVRVTVVGGSNAQLVAGVCDGQGVAWTGPPFEPGVSWAALDVDMPTDPRTGAAWTIGALAGLEPYVQTWSFPVPTQFIRVTQMSLYVEPREAHFWEIR